MSKSLSLTQMIEIVEAMSSDPELLNLYRIGDRRSLDQTKHDVYHALSVTKTARKLQEQLCDLFPGKLSEQSRLVVIPAGAFLHDIGRGLKGPEDHAKAGARIAQQYLLERSFGNTLAARIAAIVALHRSREFLAIPIAALKHFPELAIVVIADKCVGDQRRVRFLKATILRVLTFLGLARINFWGNAPHDRVNFAIKHADILLEQKNTSNDNAGRIILDLKMDDRVAEAEEFFSIYRDRFKACTLAAKSLDCCDFVIQINGHRHYFDADAERWLASVVKLDCR